MAGATAPWVGQWLARGEIAARFDAAYYADGLNGDFLADLPPDELIAKYAGAGGGGAGKFENPEERDIAANADAIVAMLARECALDATRSVVADVGAGTGLLLAPLARAAARVVALELAPDFRAWLRARAAREGLADRVEVVATTPTSVGPLAAGSLDAAALVDARRRRPPFACARRGRR